MELKVPLSRTGISLLALGGLWLLHCIPLPGLSAEVELPLPHRSIAVLGIKPWVTATILVELATLCHKPWSALRNGGSQGRASLEKASRWLWLLVAALQALSMAAALENIPHAVFHPGWSFRLLAVLTYVAAASLFVLAAGWVGRRGFGNLVVLLLVCSGLPGTLAALQLPLWEHNPEIVAPTLISLGLIAYGAWRLLPQRLAGLPRLSSGLSPATIAIIPSFFLATFSSVDIPDPLLLILTLGMGMCFANLFAWLFHIPATVASSLHISEEEAMGRLKATLPLTIIAVLVLLTVQWLSQKNFYEPAFIDVISILALIALALDLKEEWQARRRLGEAEPVWVLHRVFEAAPLKEFLEKNGIPCHITGQNYRQIGHFFLPFAPMEVLVPRVQAEQARQLLASHSY